MARLQHLGRGEVSVKYSLDMRSVVVWVEQLKEREETLW